MCAEIGRDDGLWRGMEPYPTDKDFIREPLVKVFEIPHIMSILIYLDKFGPSYKTEIYKDISHNPKMNDKLLLMQDMHLIRIEDVGGRNRKVVSLTHRGKDVVASIDMIMDTLAADYPDDDQPLDISGSRRLLKGFSRICRRRL